MLVSIYLGIKLVYRLKTNFYYSIKICWETSPV